MKLKDYNRKRDFKKTSEPKGKAGKPNKKEGLRFVVQRHDASREHYDFRLEVNGVLVSWAIPKQPVTDPDVKRLAIKVEDHPYDYLHFEGTIPEGNYGAGTVMVWDKGTYHITTSDDRDESEKVVAEEIEQGKVHIVLHGDKLKGEYSLVQMKGRGEKDQWLFFKNDDEYAGKDIPKKDRSAITDKTLKQIAGGDSDTWDPEKEPAPDPAKTEGAVKSKFPGKLKPMLATLTDEPFDKADWIFEIKYDGYRALANIQKGKVQLYSRNKNSFNEKYRPVVEALEGAKHGMVLDGEVVILDKQGRTDFKSLQNYENTQEGRLVYMVFDILYLDGYDLKDVPLLKRKEILKAVLPDVPGIRYSDHIAKEGKHFFELAQKKGLEGIMAKKADATYETNKRTTSWLKVKGPKQQELVIGGYTEPGGSRKHFGALLLGVYRGDKFIYCGKVGSGFNDDALKEIGNKLKQLERKTSPFDDEVDERQPHYVTPKLVAEVKFTAWTEDGRLRHPVFLGLREDKKAKKVTKEEPVIQELVDIEQQDDKLEFTNKQKIYFPDEGYTKQDVIYYYERVADYILPYLKDRPQSLRRNPDGIKDQGFFQKDVEGKVPDWIKTASLQSKSKGEKITYMVCNDKETLLFMANWGCIEINPWSSRLGSINNPDYIVFDLDPIDVPFKDIAKVAKALKKILDALKAPAFLKTSGGRGLHIYIPLKPEYTYNQTQTFAKLLGMQVRKQMPNLVSLERMPKNRQNMVYVDFLQNAKGKTMSSVYSMRPKPGAPIAVPLEWDELDVIEGPQQFNLKTIFNRLDEKGDLWKGFFKKTFNLKKAIEDLK